MLCGAQFHQCQVVSAVRYSLNSDHYFHICLMGPPCFLARHWLRVGGAKSVPHSKILNNSKRGTRGTNVCFNTFMDINFTPVKYLRVIGGIFGFIVLYDFTNADFSRKVLNVQDCIKNRVLEQLQITNGKRNTCNDIYKTAIMGFQNCGFFYPQNIKKLTQK